VEKDNRVFCISDARNNTVMSYKYGFFGKALFSNSMDAGVRYVLLSVEGQPVYTWDARGHRMRTEFDALPPVSGQNVRLSKNKLGRKGHIDESKIQRSRRIPRADKKARMPLNICFI
jgi:hypothetical protein